MNHHATEQIHAGYEPEAAMLRLETPGFTYSRTGNPTVAVFENRLAAVPASALTGRAR
jgi:O-acetylhomoserine (thiol)-lyase